MSEDEDNDGVGEPTLRATAKDLETGYMSGTEIDAFAGLTPAAVRRALSDARVNAESDAAKKELADLKNMADACVYTTEKALEEFQRFFTAEQVALVRDVVDDLKEAVTASDRTRIIQLIEELEQVSHELTRYPLE